MTKLINVILKYNGLANMKNDLVVMDNNLIRASYKLTVNEMRLILVSLSQIPKDEDVFE